MRTLFVVALLGSAGCTGVGKFGRQPFDDNRGTSAVARPQAPANWPDSNFASSGSRGVPPAPPGGAFLPDAPPPAAGGSTGAGLVTDPHVRDRPTVTGRTLALNPAENGNDRAVELVREIDKLQAENKTLQSRIATLRQDAVLREQAISESVKEVEDATVEVIRARNELKAYKKAVLALKEQMRQMEREEVETLKLLVTELEKLLGEAKE